MILTPLITANPFDLPQLHWREGRFRADGTDEQTFSLDSLGPVRVRLPSALSGAVPKRRAEFLAGRICATLALRSAGLPEVIGMNGRAPVWPAGAVGSISHTDNRVIATVSRTLGGLGVDCETIMPPTQADNIQGMILTPFEANLRPDALPFAAFLTLVFSAKEALYKALSPRLDHVLEFLDVTLSGLSRDRLHLSYGGEAFEARFRLDRTEVLTLVQVAT
jgi:enterobactin synthetase component D